MSCKIKCSWCFARQDSGHMRMWQGFWVCNSCFPIKSRDKVVSVRCCERCGSNNNDGKVILGKWVCDNCNFKGRPKKKKKNKYAQFSKVDNQQNYKVILNKKPKKQKQKGSKLAKIEYWNVIITDISDGKL